METRAARRTPKAREASEADFLAAYDPSQFARPSVTVDVAILTIEHGALRALLLRREDHPERGKWSLPGGFVGATESLDDAAVRTLAEKAALRGVFVEQLYTFGDPVRDPRTRIISVAYFALVAAETVASGGERNRATLRVPWRGQSGGPVEALDERGRNLRLAFDHAHILGMAVKRLRGRLDYSPIGYALLPRQFTLLELQRIHEIVQGALLDKNSFRRRMLASGELEESGAFQEGVGHRPAALYRLRGRKS